MGGGGENARREASGRWLHITTQAEASPHACSSFLPQEQKFNGPKQSFRVTQRSRLWFEIKPRIFSAAAASPFVNKAGLNGPADAMATDVGTGCAECRGGGLCNHFYFPLLASLLSDLDCISRKEAEQEEDAECGGWGALRTC